MRLRDARESLEARLPEGLGLRLSLDMAERDSGPYLGLFLWHGDTIIGSTFALPDGAAVPSDFRAEMLDQALAVAAERFDAVSTGLRALHGGA